MTATYSMLLFSIEQRRKDASEMEQKSEKILETAAGDASLLDKANFLQSRAEEERQKASCMEKLLLGGIPSAQEARVAVKEGILVLQTLRRWREFVSLPDIDYGMMLEVRATAGLKRMPIQIIPKWDWQPPRLPEPAEPEFVWDDSSLSAPSSRFIPHLKNIIELDRETSEWIDAASEPQLLSFAGLRKLGYNLEGTTDVLVARRSAVRARWPAKGSRMLFDIRRQITDLHLLQAEARLVLANLHAPAEKPLMVVSDLCQDWHMLYMDGDQIWHCVFPYRAYAAKVITDYLAGRTKSGRCMAENSLLQRRRIAERLAPGSAVA